MNEGLKYCNSVFGSIPELPQRGERKLVGCSNSQVELAVGVYAFILSIGQPPTCRLDHSIELLQRSRLGLELSNLYEVIEFLLAHS